MEPIIAIELLEVMSENINLMFQRESTPAADTNSALRPDFTDDYMCMISLANQKFQGQMVVGFPESVVNDMLAEVMQLASNPVESAELLKASLGELLNTVSGAFAQRAPLLEAYECLDLSTPSVYSKDSTPFFCKSEGFCGKLNYSNGDVINVYISVNPYMSMDKDNSTGGDDFDLEDFLGGDDLDDLLNGL